MSEVRLSAETRTEFGKGGARRTRRAGKIPAVIYGHGGDPRHVSLPAREFANAIRHGGANVLLTLEIEGKDELAIPKSIQRHPIKNQYEHVDLLVVRRGEKVTIDVRLTLVGDITPGGLLSQENNTVTVEAEATHLPTEIQVDISGLNPGAQITAGQLVLPAGSTLVTDPEQLMLAVNEAPSAEQMDADTGGAPAEGSASTGDAAPAAGQPAEAGGAS